MTTQTNQDGGWADVAAWSTAKLLRGWKLVLSLGFLGTAIATAIAFSIDKTYQAETTLVCQGGKSKGLSVGGDLDIGGLLGMGSGSDVPPMLVQSVLKSNELAEFAIHKFRLDTVWGMDKGPKPPLWENLVRAWGGSFGFFLDEENVVHLTYRDKSPQLAAKVLGAVTVWADSAYMGLRHKHSEKNSAFFLRLMSERKGLLTASEDTLVAFQRKHNLVEPEFEAAAGQKLSYALQEQLARTQAEMEMVRLSSGEGGATFQQLAAQTKLIRDRIAKLESQELGARSGAKGRGRMLIWLEHQRLRREIMIHGAVFQVLVQQFEQSELEARKDVPTFTVLDPVRVPTKKISPPRAVIMLLGMLLGLGLGSFLSIFRAEIVDFRLKFMQHLRVE